MKLTLRIIAPTADAIREILVDFATEKFPSNCGHWLNDEVGVDFEFTDSKELFYSEGSEMLIDDPEKFGRESDIG